MAATEIAATEIMPAPANMLAPARLLAPTTPEATFRAPAVKTPMTAAALTRVATPSPPTEPITVKANSIAVTPRPLTTTAVQRSRPTIAPPPPSRIRKPTPVHTAATHTAAARTGAPNTATQHAPVRATHLPAATPRPAARTTAPLTALRNPPISAPTPSHLPATSPSPAAPADSQPRQQKRRFRPRTKGLLRWSRIQGSPWRRRTLQGPEIRWWRRPQTPLAHS